MGKRREYPRASEMRQEIGGQTNPLWLQSLLEITALTYGTSQRSIGKEEKNPAGGPREGGKKKGGGTRYTHLLNGGGKGEVLSYWVRKRQTTRREGI